MPFWELSQFQTPSFALQEKCKTKVGQHSWCAELRLSLVTSTRKSGACFKENIFVWSYMVLLSKQKTSSRSVFQRCKQMCQFALEEPWFLCHFLSVSSSECRACKADSEALERKANRCHFKVFQTVRVSRDWELGMPILFSPTRKVYIGGI